MRKMTREEEFRETFRKWYELSEKCLKCRKWEEFRASGRRVCCPCDTCPIWKEKCRLLRKWVHLGVEIGEERACEIMREEVSQ